MEFSTELAINTVTYIARGSDFSYIGFKGSDEVLIINVALTSKVYAPYPLLTINDFREFVSYLHNEGNI